MQQKLVIGGVVVALVLGAYAVFFGGSTETIVRETERKVGAIPGTEISCPEFCVGGVCEHTIAGACGSATTTLFRHRNPYGATSTAELLYIRGIANATSTVLQVGTSTLSALTANVPYAIWVNTTIATSTSFHLSGGVRNGPLNNTVDAGSGTILRGIVGPSEYFSAFATTSGVAANGTQFTGGYASCFYGIKFTK